MKKCPFCAEDIQDAAILCKHCRSDLRDDLPNLQHPTPAPPPSAQAAPTPRPRSHLPKSTAEKFPLVAQIKGQGVMPVTGSFGRAFGWFLLTNAAAVLSLTLLSGGALAALAPVVVLAGMTFPFIGLWLSRWLASRAHGIRTVQPGAFRDEQEQALYEVVAALGARAGLPRTPEIGIYDSLEPNAFATGPSRCKALIAFSTALLSGLDEREIAAVAAHEVAHVANGDMLVMSIVQGAVNALALLITVPLWFVQVVAFFSEHVGVLMYWLISVVRFVVTAVLLFLGSLVVKAFSRQREYRADELAARLFEKDAMVSALQALGGAAPVAVPREQAAYAAFKINAGAGCMTLVSTHPAIEQRITRLEGIFAPQASSVGQ